MGLDPADSLTRVEAILLSMSVWASAPAEASSSRTALLLAGLVVLALAARLLGHAPARVLEGAACSCSRRTSRLSWRPLYSARPARTSGRRSPGWP